MELRKISLEEWDKLLVQYDFAHSYLQSSTVSLIAHLYQRNLDIYAYFNGKQFYFAFILFEKAKIADLPTHFFYSPFFFNRNVKDYILNKAIKESFIQLKGHYKAIELKLAPSIMDIRGFVWAGFKHKVYFTLHKSLQEGAERYSENIRRQLSKISKDDTISTKIEFEIEKLIEIHKRFMHKNGLSHWEAELVGQWISQWHKEHRLIAFGLYEAEQLKGSAFLTYDKKQAYLISIEGGDAATFGQTALYDFIFQEFRQIGIETIDLLGANLQGVAEYKSKLGSALKSYYIVSYRRRQLLFDVKNMLKNMLKKWIKG